MNKLEKISSLLEVTIYQLLGFNEKLIFQNSENAFSTNQKCYTFSDKEREQYEFRINHLEKRLFY